MSKRKSDGQAAESSSPPEIVCILMVDNTFDEFEVEICCQRTNGVDRAFATDKDLDWLRDERPSESTLAYSAETLLFGIVARCLYYVGEPVDVRAGLLSKKHVWAIIRSVRREMKEIKKENEVWREAEIVTKARQLGLSPQASSLSERTWVAYCPGTKHPLELQPKRNRFYCGYCRVGGDIDKLNEIAAGPKSVPGESIGWRTLH
jgi:hypothetical protein